MRRFIGRLPLVRDPDLALRSVMADVHRPLFRPVAGRRKRHERWQTTNHQSPACPQIAVGGVLVISGQPRAHSSSLPRPRFLEQEVDTYSPPHPHLESVKRLDIHPQHHHQPTHPPIFAPRLLGGPPARLGLSRQPNPAQRVQQPSIVGYQQTSRCARYASQGPRCDCCNRDTALSPALAIPPKCLAVPDRSTRRAARCHCDPLSVGCLLLTPRAAIATKESLGLFGVEFELWMRRLGAVAPLQVIQSHESG